MEHCIKKLKELKKSRNQTKPSTNIDEELQEQLKEQVEKIDKLEFEQLGVKILQQRQDKPNNDYKSSYIRIYSY